MAPEVAGLFAACPFLPAAIDVDDLDLSTVVFGSVGRLLIGHGLPRDDEKQVFAYFNAFAARADISQMEVLGTGAIELFNDDASSQRLGRAEFRGRALELLEEYRLYWGQPDYGDRSVDG